MNGMSGEMDDVRRRLEALEAEVDRLRDDAAHTRALSAMADRDAADVRATARANTQMLNALRETQLEQSRVLQEHGRVLQEHGRVLRDLAEVVGGVATGQAAVLEELRLLRGER